MTVVLTGLKNWAPPHAGKEIDSLTRLPTEVRAAGQVTESLVSDVKEVLRAVRTAGTDNWGLPKIARWEPSLFLGESGPWGSTRPPFYCDRRVALARVRLSAKEWMSFSPERRNSKKSAPMYLQVSQMLKRTKY